MENSRTDLYEYFGAERPENAQGYLQSLIHFQSEEYCARRKRPAMVVVAGGGYAYTSDREKEPIATFYFSKGYNVFTLDYSVSPVVYPAQLTEACMAVAYVRENADALGVSADEIAVIGFSAGGHLAGMLATVRCGEDPASGADDGSAKITEQQTSDPQVAEILKERYKICRPDAVILSYPVVSYKYDYISKTIGRLCGGNQKLCESLSVEKRVTEYSAPAFIWCTADDESVPAENSLVLAKTYAEKNVPYELHVFAHGPHGLSVCNEETAPEGSKDYILPSVERWLELSFTWLKNRGFSIKTSE